MASKRAREKRGMSYIGGSAEQFSSIFFVGKSIFYIILLFAFHNFYLHRRTNRSVVRAPARRDPPTTIYTYFVSLVPRARVCHSSRPTHAPRARGIWTHPHAGCARRACKVNATRSALHTHLIILVYHKCCGYFRINLASRGKLGRHI